MWFLLPFLTVLLVIVALLLVIIILMQRPKSEGLGAAFGGGVTDDLFGVQTTNVLSRITVWLGVFFFVLTLLISMLHVKFSSGETAVQKQLLKKTPSASAPKTLPAPVAATTTPAVATPTEDATPKIAPSMTPQGSKEIKATPAASAAPTTKGSR